MPIQFNRSYQYVWQKDTIAFNAQAIDSLRIDSPREALGNSILIVEPKDPITINVDSQQWHVATLVVVVMCIYCYVLFRFIRPIRLIFKNSFAIGSTLAIIENPSRDFNKFLSISRFMALFALSITVMTAVMKNVKLTPEYNIVVFLVAVVLLALINLIRGIIRQSAGKITQTSQFFEYIGAIESFNIALISVIITPLAIALPFWEPIFKVTVYTLSGTYLYHIIRLYAFIKGKKFSFMQWFLYLCGVELAPLCVIVAAIVLMITTVLR